MADRTILHADLNAFYASVECLARPELRRVPMAVAGDEAQRHGIILAKNDLARARGVKTAEPIWRARQKCPGLVTVPPRHQVYHRYSLLVKGIYQRYTDRVESFGPDEAWLDITGRPEEGRAFADFLRRTVREETGLTVSVGVSWNKIFAKLASDLKKPDATTVIDRENYRAVVWPLPADALLFVGRATARTLARYGIHTIGGIAAADPELLRRALGRPGRGLWVYANGRDSSPVARFADAERAKSVGNSVTLPQDVDNFADARKIVLELAETVAARLRAQNLRCRTVQITMKDRRFHTEERQAPVEPPACTTGEIAAKALELLRKNCDFHPPLRLIGVRACDLTDTEGGEQLSFGSMDSRHERMEQLEHSIDSIRGRFGPDAVKRAVFLPGGGRKKPGGPAPEKPG